MLLAKELSTIYEIRKDITSRYVHATSRGHEAIQIATAMQLNSGDYLYPYYRDDAMLLGIGIPPYELILQLLAKKTDIFSGGKSYYSHPSLKDQDKPNIPHQSSATGMQAIPATGCAMGIQYKTAFGLWENKLKNPIVVCSMGDAAITEGEVSEAFQMAVLKKLPILYIIQDNGWSISAKANEYRAQDPAEFASGFIGLKTYSIDGSDFETCFATVSMAIRSIRKNSSPVLIHAKVSLLNHHTSGVRSEYYRDDLINDASNDPILKLEVRLKEVFGLSVVNDLKKSSKNIAHQAFEKAILEPDSEVESLSENIFSDPGMISEEMGERQKSDLPITMVDAGIKAIDEILTANLECLVYGQDVGERLGGVFRETATLAQKHGTNRVFNTPIQEAFIVGSTVGLSAVGLKPIVEVQFADFIFPAINQLFTEVSRSCYLTNGKYPISMVLRVPCGAYGGGGPYHSSSIENILSCIKGIKIVYPSNAGDLKGLLKAAYYDPNPVVVLEHKGLYWSNYAKTKEPSEDYILPIGKGTMVQVAMRDSTHNRKTVLVITYGMGIHWAVNCLQDNPDLKNRVSILDLRSLHPLDWTLIEEQVKFHGKCLLLTEESKSNSFMQSLQGKIQEDYFEFLEAPIRLVGSKDVPAIPLNRNLEVATLPTSEAIIEELLNLINY